MYWKYKTSLGTILEEDSIVIKESNSSTEETFTEIEGKKLVKFDAHKQLDHHKISTESSNGFDASKSAYPLTSIEASFEPTTQNFPEKVMKTIVEDSLNENVNVTSKVITTNKLLLKSEIRNNTISSSTISPNLRETNVTSGSFISTTTNRYTFESSKGTVVNSTKHDAIPNLLTPQQSSPLICSNPSCVKVANDIRSSIGKNPCADPVKFVCGNNGKGDYLEIPEDRSSWGLTEKSDEDRNI